MTPDPSKLEHLMRESLSQSLEDRRLLKDFIEKNNESKNNEHLIEENKRVFILFIHISLLFLEK